MAGITDIDFLTRTVSNYAVGGPVPKEKEKEVKLEGIDFLSKKLISPEDFNPTATYDDTGGSRLDANFKNFDPKFKMPESVMKGMRGVMSLLDPRKKIKYAIDAAMYSPAIMRSIKNFMMPEADTGLGFTMKMSDEGTSVGEKVISKVDEFKNKQKLLKEAYKDKEVLKLNKILPNFAKLTEDEKYEAAVSFVNILNSPSKKLALYDLQRKIAQGTKKTGRPTGVDSVAAYANKKNMIPEGLMGKSSKETVQFEPKAMRSNQEVIDVFNNLKKWKSSKAGKLDPTGRSLTGTNLDEIMNIGELTPKKRQDIIRILRDDLDSIGLIDISRPGKIKIPKNKSAQKLLEEMNLTTFPRDFQFATSGLLTTPQKIQYNKIIASLDSAVQAKGLKVGVGTDFGTKNIGNRMLRQAFQNDIPLTEIFKKLEKVDIDGVADIIKRRNMYNKKIQEFIKLGYDVDKAEIGHITAIAEDALLALDLDNLVLQAAKANRKETGLRNKIKNILNNPEKSPYKMEEVIKELEDLGIETKVGDKIYGKAKDIEKELRNLEIGASDPIFGYPMKDGGMMNINDITRSLKEF
tara:strand:+ start:35 stop:1765 length:1731 start_codon:yes stop_codon:yes gene_type:complete